MASLAPSIRRALEDESIAKKTKFHGFTSSVSDISSKSHMARELKKALADEIVLTQGFSVLPTGSSHQSGRNVLSPLVDQLLQQGSDRSQRSFGIYEVETMGVTPAAAGQPGPADESVLIGPSSAGQSDFELVETMKLCEQSSRKD